MTDQPTGDPTHGLSVQHADALWDAVAIPGPAEPTFPMQHERVCRAVAEILAELTPASPAVPVSSPPPDRTALRDRIAEALAAADGWTWTPDYDKSLSPVWQGYLKRADVVLPVLPPPVDGSATLREAADRLWALANRKTERGAGVLWAADWLRRLAAEAQQPETGACLHLDGCDGECPCPPSCGCCTVTAAPQPETPNTARAAVYREIADRLTTDAHGMQPDWARIYKRDAAVKVREWADRLDGEGRQPDAETHP